LRPHRYLHGALSAAFAGSRCRVTRWPPRAPPAPRAPRACCWRMPAETQPLPSSIVRHHCTALALCTAPLPATPCTTVRAARAVPRCVPLHISFCTAFYGAQRCLPHHLCRGTRRLRTSAAPPRFCSHRLYYTYSSSRSARRHAAAAPHNAPPPFTRTAATFSRAPLHARTAATPRV
jgi:hypothetical protein